MLSNICSCPPLAVPHRPQLDTGSFELILFLLVQALPLTRFQAVVALAVGRLADKSVLVCKNAIQLLASFLANNPFSCKVRNCGVCRRGMKWKQGWSSVT